MRNRLLQLLAENRRQFTPIQSRIKAEDGVAAIYLYDPIVSDRMTAEWFGGVCPQDFVPAVRAIDAEQITLYTNCPGGDVFAAEAMAQALREHSANITMQIEGYAASAATGIACACDEVLMTPSSKYMIHQTWCFAMGNESDMLAMADLLRKCDDSMYAEYAARTGQDMEQIKSWCAAETWFTAEDAVKYGFADKVLQTSAPGKGASASWNLSVYQNAPKEVADPAEPEPAPQENFATQEHRERQQQRLHRVQVG